MLKSNGPRMLPCVTPELTGSLVDRVQIESSLFLNSETYYKPRQDHPRRPRGGQCNWVRINGCESFQEQLREPLGCDFHGTSLSTHLIIVSDWVGHKKYFLLNQRPVSMALLS